VKLSARNKLVGTVTSITKGEAIANVGLDVNGQRLVAEMSCAGDVPARFVVAAAIVRHLLTDPVLPDELLPADWPGTRLRTNYNDFAAELTERRDGIRLVEAT